MIEQHLALPAAGPVHQGEVGGHNTKATAPPLELPRQRPSPLKAGRRDIQHRYTRKGKAREDGITEFTPTVNPGHRKGEMETQLITDGLQGMRPTERHQHFLECKDIGSDLLDDRLGSTRIGSGSTTVPSESMHVVARDPELLTRRLLGQRAQGRANQREMGDRE